MIDTRKTRKKPANRLEYIKMKLKTNETSEEIIEKKDNKKFTV